MRPSSLSGPLNRPFLAAYNPYPIDFNACLADSMRQVTTIVNTCGVGTRLGNTWLTAPLGEGAAPAARPDERNAGFRHLVLAYLHLANPLRPHLTALSGCRLYWYYAPALTAPNGYHC